MKGGFMKKYLFLLLVFLFQVLGFGAGAKDSSQVLATASKEPGYQLVASTTSGMSGVMIKWIKEDSLKTGKVTVLFQNEKGDSIEINGDFSTFNGTKTLTFSAINGAGEAAKKFIKNSNEITLVIQDKKGNKSEEIKFDVVKLASNWK
mgnify:CR=1 FL=1